MPVANPVGFITQKILIHRRRNRGERAKDIMYIHDTLETFAPRIADLRREWIDNIKPVLHANRVRTLERAVNAVFGEVTDPIRGAVQVAEGRRLTPEAIRETCHAGLSEIIRPA